MTLSDWLTSKNMLPSAFATRIGVDKSLVGRWLDGSVMPRRENLKRIADETEGQVTANDFISGEEPIPNPNAPAVTAAE